MSEWEGAAADSKPSIFSAIHGKWIWNQMEHKNKDEKIYPDFWMHPPNRCSRSTSRIFYFYALGVSSAMREKGRPKPPKDLQLSKMWKTFPAGFKQKPCSQLTGLLDQYTGHTGCFGSFFFIFGVSFWSVSFLSCYLFSAVLAVDYELKCPLMGGYVQWNAATFSWIIIAIKCSQCCINTINMEGQI